MKDKVINDLLSRIATLEYEVERLEKRNKEIYEGFMATTEELCEATKETERLNKNIQATRNCILNDISILKTRNDISQEEMVTRLKATLIILGSDKE